jgi:hypothetical protein
MAKLELRKPKIKTLQPGRGLFLGWSAVVPKRTATG